MSKGNPGVKRKPLITAFTEKYFKTSCGCWVWTACTDKQGYGFIRHLGKNLKAHRVSYTLYKGTIPENLQICHTCDTPDCVNPDHLFLGSNSENQCDAVSKGRHFSKTRITKEMADAIRLDRGKGMVLSVLATKHSVSIATVSRISNNLRWK